MGVGINVTAVGIRALEVYLESGSDRARTSLMRAMHEATMIILLAAKANAPVGVTAHLQKGIYREVRVSGGSITGIVSTGAGEPYGVCVEMGTVPHKPPFEMIKRWVIAKIRPEPSRVWFVTKCIVEKIAKEGTKENPFMERSYLEQQGNVNLIFEAGLKRITGSTWL